MSRIVILSDRIKELSHTTGQGAFVLDGAATGFTPFGDFYEYGDVVWYAATDGTSYEVGSGEYILDGSTNTLSRHPFRNSNLNAGPYYLNDSSSAGSTEGVSGYFFPLYLTKSKASGVSGSTSIHKHAFSGYPGVTFYMPNSPMIHGGQESWLDGSGSSYATSGAAINFSAGVKEVYVTYPAKYSVTTSFGVSGLQEPEHGGVAFWGSEQSLDYDANFAWDTQTNKLGITQTSPEYAVDIGGNIVYSQVRASGFTDGGSGVFFSGGVALPQSSLKTASGGRQVEPFFRNELDSQTGSDAVFSLSGLVDERLLLQTQVKGSIFAGPASGCVGGCSPDYPTFRYLEVEDVPDLSSSYVVQKNLIPATEVNAGALALYSESGIIEYDNNVVFLKASDTLDVNGIIKSSGDVYLSGNVELGNDLNIVNNATVGGNMTVSGNLDVQGDVTYVDSNTVTVFDKQIELASMSGTAIYDHGAIDSGGMVLKSTDGDHFWVFSSGSLDGSSYDPAWLTNVDIWTSGGALRFNDGPTISGAYHAGSGLELHNGVEFNVSRLFNIIGESGTASSLPISGHLHQNDVLTVSGSAGTQVYFDNNAHAASGFEKLLYVDSTALSGWVTASLSLAGGMSSFLLGDGLSDAGSESITNGVNVFISGVSGIRTHYDHSFNRIEINPNEVSGALKGQIDAISLAPYNFIITDGLVTQDVVTIDQYVAISGASGINVKLSSISSAEMPSGMLFTVHASGLVEEVDHVSGLLVESSGWAAHAIGGLAGGYGHWKLNASGDGDTFGSFTTDEITTAQAVTVSGLSGISVEYTAGDQGLRIAPTLSGLVPVINYGSGLVYYDSGVNRPMISLDLFGSGQLTHLLFNDDIIRIGEDAFHDGSGLISLPGSETVANSGDIEPVTVIGYRAGIRASGVKGSIIIGNYAGHEASGSRQIMIGHGAGYNTRQFYSSVNDNCSFDAGLNILIGQDAGSGLDNSNKFSRSSVYDCHQGSNDIIAIGEGATATSHSIQSTVAIGSKAGIGSRYLYHSILLGENAGTSASGYAIYSDAGEQTAGDRATIIAIGTWAANNIKSSEFIAISWAAGANANLSSDYATQWAGGSYESLRSIYIGDYAGGSITGDIQSIGIGTYAAFGQKDVSYNACIGESAGRSASGVTHSIMIGQGAGEDAKDWYRSVAIGRHAGMGAKKEWDKEKFYSTNMIGYAAGKWASGCDYSNMMGYEAGMLSSGCYLFDMIGLRAGLGAHDVNYSTAIGHYAGGGDVGVGGASGVYHSVMIGNQAGRWTMASNSVFLGLYAGRYHHGDHAIIIKNNSDLNGGAPWADYDSEGIIDIGNVIQGQATADIKRLRLGDVLTDETELSNTCVSIKSESATDAVLKLVPATSQSSSQLISMINSGATENEVITADGLLRLPVATTLDSGELKTAGGEIITRSAGVVALYSVGGTRYIVVCDGTTWYRTNDQLQAL